MHVLHAYKCMLVCAPEFIMEVKAQDESRTILHHSPPYQYGRISNMKFVGMGNLATQLALGFPACLSFRGQNYKPCSPNIYEFLGIWTVNLRLVQQAPLPWAMFPDKFTLFILNHLLCITYSQRWLWHHVEIKACLHTPSTQKKESITGCMHPVRSNSKDFFLL